MNDVALSPEGDAFAVATTARAYWFSGGPDASQEKPSTSTAQGRFLSPTCGTRSSTYRPKTHGPETLRNYWGFGSERNAGPAGPDAR